MIYFVLLVKSDSDFQIFIALTRLRPVTPLVTIDQLLFWHGLTLLKSADTVATAGVRKPTRGFRI
jgi:hypothetical protein